MEQPNSIKGLVHTKALENSRRGFFVFFVLAVVANIVGCGSRTGLPNEASADAALPTDAPLECRADEDCRDALMCTDERCEGGACVRRPLDERCEGGRCEVVRCDPAAGCVSVPRRCDDGVECTIDDCHEVEGCVHEPDDSRCPVSTRCDVVAGCQAIAWVHDGRRIYQVDLPSGTVTPLGVVPLPAWTDIALGPDRSLYGVAADGLVYRISQGFADVDALLMLPGDTVALEVGPDGGLYSAGVESGVFRTNLETGAVELVGDLPPGWATSGDIAFVGDRLLITVTDEPLGRGGENAVAAFDDGAFRIVGTSGPTCLWGIAAFGEDVYGFSCFGGLYRINSETGATELVRGLGIEMRGAAAR